MAATISKQQILALGTINKAYNFLLPMVQKMKMENYVCTENDELIELVFRCIAIEKTSRKELRSRKELWSTLAESLEMFERIAN